MYVCSNKKPLFIITLDVKKAFDVVWHASLLRKMFSISDANSWSFLDSNLRTNSSVRLQNQFGQCFTVQQGVGQGKIMSTHNYKCYVNDVLDLLTNSNCGSRIGASYIGSPTCADDIVLLANSVSDMQTQLNIVHTYSQRERYEIHPDKSKCITFGTKHPPTFLLKDKEIPNENSLTHLGIDRHDSVLSPDVYIDERISMGRRTAYSLMGSGFHGVNGISPAISIQIYRTYVMPRVMFGLEAIILKSKQISKLNDFHKKCVRELQSLPVRTALPAIYLLGGILPMEAYLDMQIATLIYIIGHDLNSVLADVAIWQIANKNIKSHSWFIYASARLSRYDLDLTTILRHDIYKAKY